MSFNIPSTNKKRVVIVGGGFGGLKLANKLKKSDFQVVLIDKNNYHQFQPLLYQVASSGLEPSSISFPFRKIFQRRKNFYFRMAEVKAILPADNKIETSIGVLHYDYLVLAAGTTTNYFGNEHVMERSLPMKSIEEALGMRNVLLSNFEKALTTTDLVERQALLNIVVVGGGATGVEVSGVLSEMKRFVIPKDYPDLKDEDINIFLIEGSPRLLGGMSTESSGGAEKFLREMGVRVMLNTKVIDYEGDKVILEGGESVLTKTVVWVSGVKAVSFKNIGDDFLARGARIKVNEFNLVKGLPNVFAIGDVCYMTEPDYPNGHPQVAQVAIQQGKLLAENLQRIEHNQLPKAFHYKNLGSLATIGRNKAVADFRSVKMQGFLAWVVWMTVHLRSILGVRNKLVVLINWVWNYLTYDQSIRLIIFARKRKGN